MKTKFIEATQPEGKEFNWGKFMLARFEPEEWARRDQVSGSLMLRGRGWDTYHILVTDLQTGEGAIFRPGGYARGDLKKHKIWVCPMFEPFLTWLYTQDTTDIEKLPALVRLDAPPEFQGYRREGPDAEAKTEG
jgi:hypothetical protein